MPADRTHRVFAALALLIGIWIVVYWSWGPSAGGPGVTLADEGDIADDGPGIESSPLWKEGPDSVETPEAVPPAPERAEPTLPSPPAFVQHRVARDGASWRSISIDLFGTPDHARAIARANPFVDERRLRPGRVVRIPAELDPDAIQGGARAEESPADPPEPVRMVEYTVRRGDSLSVISQRFFGTVRKADLLFEHNKERLGLRDANSIREGQVLLIPLQE